MIYANETIQNALKSPVRQIKALVELYSNSSTGAVLDTFTSGNKIKSFDVDRVGAENKFYGFGITHKANLKLIDKDGTIAVNAGNCLKSYFNTVGVFPELYVTEVHRDEITNELSITAYDRLYNATEHTIDEITLTAPYTIGDVVTACAGALGLTVDIADIDAFNLSFATGANFDGKETLREVLDAGAEATQTVYFITTNDVLKFKRLEMAETADLYIDKADYIEFKQGTNRRLSDVTSTNNLGDSVTVTTGVSGTTQYVRNNPFWELREDIDVLLEDAISVVGDLTIAQIDLKWRGNYLLEPADKIGITTKDGLTAFSFLFNDSFKYDGTLTQVTNWSFKDEEKESTNSTNLGETLKQTYARVDKANKEITLLASEAEETKEIVNQIKVNTEGITLSTIEDINNDIAELRQKAEVAVTPEDVQISIQNELADGVNKVITTTGFTFDESGLTVSKSNSEISTTITTDGMTVERNGDEVLIADNEGVKAEDLHATTYLIIGTNSRFEDFNGRTCCFWIGG